MTEAAHLRKSLRICRTIATTLAISMVMSGILMLNVLPFADEWQWKAIFYLSAFGCLLFGSIAKNLKRKLANLGYMNE